MLPHDGERMVRMVPQEFRMEVDEDTGEPVLKLFGELDLVSSEAVQNALVALARSTVVADLACLEFIDSTGLAALLRARRRMEEAGHHLEIRGARGATRQVFEAAGLLDVLDD
jgi:anti-sigma B factor antagonist